MLKMPAVAAPTPPGGSGPAAEVLVDDPLWMFALKALVIFVMLLLLTLFAIWWERKLIGWMQNRRGPNRAGPAGVLQSLADGLKLPFKEDIVPSKVDKIVHFLAPVVVATPVFITFSVIPMGPTVWMFGEETALQVTDLPVAGLLVLVTASIGVYGFVLAGWASRSPYALLGGLRSSAQVISYEIAMALSFVAVFLYAGALSTSAIVEAQEGVWYAVALIPSFVIYLITMVGETNRLPFDLPEGEGELVGGYHTEYSSMKFAMFFLAEYINIWTVSAIATTFFLGGWHAPWPFSLIPGANAGWIPLIWFFGKIFLVFCCFVWLRAAVPRVRYDQLMRLGWKVLIPINLGWIMVVATIRAWQNATGDDRIVAMAVGGALVAGLLGTWLYFDSAAEKKKLAREAAKKAEFERLSREPTAGGFPVPPLDLPHYHGAPRPEIAPQSEARSETSEKEVSGA